jgi:hypothetical protein
MLAWRLMSRAHISSSVAAKGGSGLPGQDVAGPVQGQELGVLCRTWVGGLRPRQIRPPMSYGPPWAHYLSGYQDRLLGGPLGLPGLRYMASNGVEHKDYKGVVLG